MSVNVASTATFPPGTGALGAAHPIVSDPKFQEMVRGRNSLALTLTVVMMAIYLAFILLSAFAPGFMAAKVASTTSVGIVFGLAVIAVAFVLTAIYVARANSRFDDLNAALRREYGR